MRFEEKYTNVKEADPKKIEISNEAYAIGEMIEKLINQLEITRLQR